MKYGAGSLMRHSSVLHVNSSVVSFYTVLLTVFVSTMILDSGWGKMLIKALEKIGI